MLNKWAGHLIKLLVMMLTLHHSKQNSLETGPTNCTLSNRWSRSKLDNIDFPRKIVELFWVKTRENAAVLDFLAVNNFDFTRKIVKNIWVKNSWKCWGFALFSYWQLWFHEKIVKFYQNWIFGQKFDFSNSVWIFWNFLTFFFKRGEEVLRIRHNWDGLPKDPQSLWDRKNFLSSLQVLLSCPSSHCILFVREK